MTKKRKKRTKVLLSDLRLRVMADYASSGIWVIGPIGPFRHGMIEHGALGLPSALAKRFEQWIEQYWCRLDNSDAQHLQFDAAEFNKCGRSLAQELKAHVGSDGYVEYLPELDEGSLDEAEVIE